MALCLCGTFYTQCGSEVSPGGQGSCDIHSRVQSTQSPAWAHSPCLLVGDKQLFDERF